MTDPEQIWWTISEIAAAELPGFPTSKGRISAMIAEQGWDRIEGVARKRRGRGGAMEYHWSAFPVPARAHLSGDQSDAADTETKAALAWKAFDALPQKAKDKASSRLAILEKVEALAVGDVTRSLAVKLVASQSDVGERTIWNWFDLVSNAERPDWLPALAPKHRAAKSRKSRATEVDPDFRDLVLGAYLRPEQPSLTASYDQACRAAVESGIPTVPLHTMRRWITRNVSKTTMVAKRDGADALKAMYPAQTRDRSALRVLEVVNADFHRFDVFVRWPEDTGGPAGIERPQLVAFQDVHSGKILSWRVDRTPNARAVQLAIGDMVKAWGIPSKLLLDNGREFAAKSVTGGTPTRFRFNVRDDDVPGLVTALGTEVIWATPYSGQSKPIERAFRDMCDRVAKHPAYAGAYTGNSPGAKPENYGSKAIELDKFLEVLTEEIELHNAKDDRRSEVAYGRSFNDVFNEGYKAHPIRKATDAQLRMLMLGAEGVMVSRGDAAIRFMGNRYWAGWLHEHQGQKIIARFDPADLQAGLYVYAMTGEYLGEADCLEKTGFTDVDGARAHNRARRQWVRAQKDLAKAESGLSPAEVADALSRARRTDTAPNPDAKVVRPLMPFVPLEPPVAAPPSPAVERAQKALVVELSTGRERTADDETPNTRFKRALDLEQRAGAGESLTEEQARWLSTYQDTAEYRSRLAMWKDFGDGMFA